MADQLNTSDSILLKKITELDPVSAAEATALLLLYQEGATKKITSASLLQGLAKSLDIAAAYVSLVGIQAISGEKTFTSTLNLLNASMGLAIDTAAGAESKIALKTAGNNRWLFVSSDANKTFELKRYSEAGALIDSPIKVSTATGKVETGSLKSSALAVDTASGTAGRLALTTLDQNRWQLLKSATAESGSNVGSDLTVNRYADDGSYIDTPITVSRSAGSTTFNKDLVANQKIISNGEIQAKFVNANRTGTLATQHTILANQASTTGFNISAIAAVSENVDFTCLQVTGKEKDTGTIKVAHIKPDGVADNNAAALSLDLQGVGTAAKGIYINSTPAGGTTGDLIDVRNNSVQQMRVTAGGSLSVATDFSAPEGKVSVKLSNSTDVAIAVKANSDAGADLIKLKKSSGSTALSVSSTGVLTAAGRIEGTDPNKAVAINTATATDGRLSFDEAGASRWQVIRKATSADLTVQRYNSSGTFQDTPITVASADGSITLSKSVIASGAQLVTTGELKAQGTIQVRNSTVPTSPPDGNTLYSEDGFLKFKDAAGSVKDVSATVSQTITNATNITSVTSRVSVLEGGVDDGTTINRNAFSSTFFRDSWSAIASASPNFTTTQIIHNTRSKLVNLSIGAQRSETLNGLSGGQLLMILPANLRPLHTVHSPMYLQGAGATKFVIIRIDPNGNVQYILPDTAGTGSPSLIGEMFYYAA